VREWLPRTPGARLTIVPHGPLLSLSFAALQDGRERYLLEDYAISYVPASAVIPLAAARVKPGARAGNFLLVADPSPLPVRPGEAPLPRLPGARAEARDIAQLVSSARVTLLTGASADEASVKRDTARRAVLHFATHAIVQDADPLQSFLALAKSPDGSGDGRLTAEKIYGLHLDADLVVLSACRSGEGKITGDGIAALGRAFFYAGTPSVILSLWDVADQPANRLLPAFYKAWLHGADKASALRSAQLQLLHDLRAGIVTISTPAGKIALTEQPAFWAGFILLGETN
jgi:CHAT domain-containing protein